MSIKIALAGNPNCGKTTLFNNLTGSNQYVGNWPGVTVEKKEGKLKGEKDVIIQDLPGIYSLSPYTLEEVVSRTYLVKEKPDAILNIIDGTNIERNLYLTTQLIELGIPVVVAVNMMDLARRRGIELKAEDLSRELGVPVVETIAVRKQGIDRLTELLSDPSAWSSWVPEATEEDDLARLNRILRKLGLDKIFPDEFSDRIDRVVLNPWLGVTILMIILFFVFQAVFAWSAYPMEWIEEGFNMLGELCAEHLPDGFVKDLLVDAVIGGVGGVVVFLPQILILFFFILLMEESGYLPRAAFLLDRTMGSVGLSGRSFLPLLSGYACAVPAIMAARIVGNQRDRWATIAIAPLLTCGARLPVYAVMIAAFVPDVSVWGVGLQGLVLFALYCLGMVGALVVAWILKHTTGKGENRTLMLELPSYHLPRIDALAHGLWQRACIYLQKVGTIILALTVFLWVLTTFPGAPAGATDPAINYSFAGMLGRALEPLFAPIGFNWQMCISLVPAMGAREVAVSVLGTLYATASDAEDALVPILQHSWTIPMGLSFLAFFVFSPSCFATLAAIKREMGTWKAPAVLWVAYTLLAYAFSFVVYRTALWVCG